MCDHQPAPRPPLRERNFLHDPRGTSITAIPPAISIAAAAWRHSRFVGLRAFGRDRVTTTNTLRTTSVLNSTSGSSLRNYCGAGDVVADLGCGTGRALVTLARHGYRGLAIDLPKKMLEVVRVKTFDGNLPIQCVQADWVELDGVADARGMIRGRENRVAALQHTRRILKPGGPFVIHVHNNWYKLWDPGGP